MATAHAMSRDLRVLSGDHAVVDASVYAVQQQTFKSDDGSRNPLCVASADLLKPQLSTLQRSTYAHLRIQLVSASPCAGMYLYQNEFA